MASLDERVRFDAFGSLTRADHMTVKGSAQALRLSEPEAEVLALLWTHAQDAGDLDRLVDAARSLTRRDLDPIVAQVTAEIGQGRQAVSRIQRIEHAYEVADRIHGLVARWRSADDLGETTTTANVGMYAAPLGAPLRALPNVGSVGADDPDRRAYRLRKQARRRRSRS